MSDYPGSPVTHLRTDPAGRRFWPTLVRLLSPLLVLGGLAGSPVEAEPPGAPVTAEAVPPPQMAGLQRHDGFVPFAFDPATGKLFLEVSHFDEPFLLLTALSAGGLDTALWWDGWPWSESGPALVHFERRDARVMLVESDARYRVPGPANAALGRAVDWAFAPSVLAVMSVVTEEADRVVVDATDFVVRDALDLSRHFGDSGGGTARFDRPRSHVERDGSHARPEHTEIETRLTFAVSAAGRSGDVGLAHRPTLTVRQRWSFVRLPPPGFEPREHDPRLGFSRVLRRLDFARTAERGYVEQWINRWRLEKKDPDAAMSEPVEPIVFYLDRALPPSQQDAVADAVRYWNDVFRTAGFEDALRTELLPPGTDPMDLRYPAVIRWSPAPGVESSYTSWVSDPRTGEMLKAIIYLDAWRDQVWLNTFAALRPALDMPAMTAEEFVGTHRRWVATHEIGHALAGLAHNDISASNVGFPVPQLYPNDDGTVRVDVSAAFHSEPTAYDAWAIRYAYATLPPDQERASRHIADEGVRGGLRFMQDDDLRSNPLSAGRLVDEDRVAELERSMAVRHILLDHFDETTIQPGEPMSLLLARLFPLYFHHQYAIESVARTVAGLEYTHAARGDGQAPTRVIDPDTQRRALASLLRILAPAELRIPERIVAMIPPSGEGTGPPLLVTVGPRAVRFFTGESGPVIVPAQPGGLIDPLGWARTLAGMVIDPLVQPARAARLVSFHARNAANPSLDEILQEIIGATWLSAVPEDGTDAALRRVAQRVVLDGLLELANSPAGTPEVRAGVLFRLEWLRSALGQQQSDDPAERAHLEAALRDIAAIGDKDH